MPKGILYIIPLPISEDSIRNSTPDFNVEILKSLRCFVVEKIKTSRRFLRAADREFPIDDSEFFELNKHDNYSMDPKVISILKNGGSVGLMSEAGYPAVADPGYKLVAKAQELGCEIKPLVGASSIIMALSASGLNGENFTFNSYIPQKEPERSKALKSAIDRCEQQGVTQIFIETPYRNQKFFEDVLKHGSNQLRMCMAMDVTGKAESIITKSVADWKKTNVKFKKIPCVFILGR